MVKLPVQDRSRKAWARVLKVAADILETQGADSFTIAEVCQQAGVSAAAIYARVRSKDALLLQAYDEVHRRIVEGSPTALQGETGTGSPTEAIDRAVASVGEVYLTHATFMRSVILLSASNPEIRRRGSEWTTQMGRDFTAALAPYSSCFKVDDADASIDLCYRMVFSSTVMHVAYGPSFASERPMSDGELLAGLQSAARRVLNVTDAQGQH